ncbi:hypothetical protein CcaCcLH18_07822 [Colletotrichum camelliae]|nr:hypothetical protein CcaCcLH18_07822 [Colletotrichum camelliae]
MDPLSIAGLTIAVLDQLWKIGNRTAELVSDFRDFDTDTRILENKIRDESNRTRALQLLLFELSSTYGGKSLFEQFDKDVQDQILVFLEQASDVLEQAYKLLSRRQKFDTKVRDPQSPAKSSFLATISPAPSSSSLSSGDLVLKRPKSFQRIKWSFVDKKRVGTIVQDFSELNGRIHESIKLWCLGTSIGVNLQHLNRLETDENSRALGFDVDARLQMATSQNQTTAKSLEISDPSLRQCVENATVFGDKFGIFYWEGKACLVEYRSYSPDSPVPIPLDDRTRDLVDKLANLLHQPKEIAFRTPSCQGWFHESFRSENVLFFPMVDSAETVAPPDNNVDLSEPWLLGFEFSRPEQYFSHGHADTCLPRDIYRHPERQQNPTQPFNKVHDIYALGVVLLEIGLWQPVLTLEKSGFSKVRDPHAIKKHLIKHAEKRLGAKMGDKYQKIVLKCLKGDFEVVDDTKEDLKLQQAFRANVVDLVDVTFGCHMREDVRRELAPQARFGRLNPRHRQLKQHIILLSTHGNIIAIDGPSTPGMIDLEPGFQAIQGVSAVESGIRQLPLVLSMVVASLMTGALIRRTGYYTPLLIIGVCFMSIGAGLLNTLQLDTPSAQWIGYQILYGFGTGCASQVPNIAAQTVLPKKDVPIGTSLMFFSQLLGGAIFISVGQNVLNNQLLERLSSVPGFNSALIESSGATSLTDLPASVKQTVLVGYNESLRVVFRLGLILTCLSILGALAMEWRSVKQNAKKEAPKAEEGQTAEKV